MKISKRLRFIAGALLTLALTAVIISLCRTTPSHEISRAQLEKLIQQKLISRASVTPSMYTGIYEVDGAFRQSARSQPQPFNITTRLEEAQIKALLEQPAIKIEVPGKGS